MDSRECQCDGILYQDRRQRGHQAVAWRPQEVLRGQREEQQGKEVAEQQRGRAGSLQPGPAWLCPSSRVLHRSWPSGPVAAGSGPPRGSQRLALNQHAGIYKGSGIKGVRTLPLLPGTLDSHTLPPDSHR